MDFRRPVEAVVPGAQGRILAVLAETTGDLNVRTIARLAAVSPAQASRILPELTRLGIVERREAPPSALFRFVDDHVAAQVIRALSRASEAALAALGRRAAMLPVLPASVVVFGSFARGEADGDSDLDVVLVRPAAVEDDEHWGGAVEEWRGFAGRLTGNRVEVVEVDESGIARLLSSGKSLWTDIGRDGLVVFGSSLDRLRRGPDA